VTVDAAFEGQYSTIKPVIGGGLSNPEFIFNKLHSAARKVIEQSWGFCVNRCRMFKAASEWRGEHWVTRFTAAIHAAIILHNICIDRNDPFFDDDELKKSQQTEFDEEEFVDYANEDHDSIQESLIGYCDTHFTVSADGKHVVSKLPNTVN